MTNLDSVLKSWDVSFLAKVHISQNYDFSKSHVWMWELDYKEGWSPKNRCYRIVVLEKTLESPLDCKEIQPVHPKGKQSWIFIARSVLKALCFGHLIRRADSLEKTLMPVKIEGKRRSGLQRMRCLDSIIISMDMNLSTLQEIVKDRGASNAAIHGVTKSQTWINDWKTKSLFLYSRGSLELSKATNAVLTR